MAEDGNKSSIMRLLIIINVILLVDIVGGYLLATRLVIPVFYKSDELQFSEELQESEEQGSNSPSMASIKKPLDAININPANSNGEIFSCDIVLVAENQMLVDELSLRDYEIMDKLSTYLSFKTVEELNDPGNWERYKNDMVDIVNSILTTGEISSLYIPQKIIQFQ